MLSMVGPGVPLAAGFSQLSVVAVRSNVHHKACLVAGRISHVVRAVPQEEPEIARVRKLSPRHGNLQAVRDVSNQARIVLNRRIDFVRPLLEPLYLEVLLLRHAIARQGRLAVEADADRTTVAAEAFMKFVMKRHDAEVCELCRDDRLQPGGRDAVWARHRGNSSWRCPWRASSRRDRPGAGTAVLGCLGGE